MDLIPWLIAILAIIWAFAILVWSKKNRIDGLIVITKDDDGKKIFSLELETDPDEIENMKFITFKVSDHPSEDLD